MGAGCKGQNVASDPPLLWLLFEGCSLTPLSPQMLQCEPQTAPLALVSVAGLCVHFHLSQHLWLSSLISLLTIHCLISCLWGFFALIYFKIFKLWFSFSIILYWLQVYSIAIKQPYTLLSVPLIFPVCTTEFSICSENLVIVGGRGGFSRET